MNIFDKQANALRIQFRDERIRIQKDANRAIGHINQAIGQVSSPEARQALRAEKARIYEATRQSMMYNRRCYTQQLEAILDESRLHYESFPSKTKLRRILRQLCNDAGARGEQSVSFAFGNGRTCEISFR